MSESSGTVRMQRTSRGNFVIRDVDQSGGYISVGTNGSKVISTCDYYNIAAQYGVYLPR